MDVNINGCLFPLHAIVTELILLNFAFLYSKPEIVNVITHTFLFYK